MRVFVLHMCSTYPLIGLHSDENILEAAIFRPVLFELTH